MSKSCQIIVILSLLYFSKVLTKSLNHNRIKRFDDRFHDISVERVETYSKSRLKKKESEKDDKNVTNVNNMNTESNKLDRLQLKSYKKCSRSSPNCSPETTFDNDGVLVIAGLKSLHYFPNEKSDSRYYNGYSTSSRTTPDCEEPKDRNCIDSAHKNIELSTSRPTTLIPLSQNSVSKEKVNICQCAASFLIKVGVKPEDCPNMFKDRGDVVAGDKNCESLMPKLEGRIVPILLSPQWLPMPPPLPYLPSIDVYVPSMMNILPPPPIMVPIPYPKYLWRRDSAKKKQLNGVKNIKILKNSLSFESNKRKNH